MSDALDYLLKVRPEAMQHYFRFLKLGGTHLDVKTRALISVITKVAGRTEAGFRQYLVRALRAGASADEIIDALLAAFPILGLSGVVWAIDIILAMDLPEFRPERFGVTPRWLDFAAIADIPEGASRRACADREVFVYRRAESLKIYDSRCPHQATNIPEPALKELVLTCPRHGWQFDLASGACIARGDRPLRSLQYKIEDGRVLVYI
jgi:nitrite reductase/ring-hydroxylating ferredoxin subunit/alkylhydroperoxidase/carboxymuconolactone decarboxylase family protein YurZ